jgi:hypothetical protein
MRETTFGGWAGGTASSGNYILNAGLFFTSILDTALAASRIPYFFLLMQNYPNPFNPSTTISYELPNGTNVTLKIYNLLGKVIRTISKGQESVGTHKIIWDGKDNFGNQVPSGAYYYQIITEKSSDIKKMILLK